MSEREKKQTNKIVCFHLHAKVMMLSAPIPASRRVLQIANLKVSDIDLWEVNEAFASVPLALCKVRRKQVSVFFCFGGRGFLKRNSLQELGVDLTRLNVNGGAMSLGHPLGGTGTKLAATLIHELERRKARYGLISICEGGGTANAIIIERLETSKL